MRIHTLTHTQHESMYIQNKKHQNKLYYRNLYKTKKTQDIQSEYSLLQGYLFSLLIFSVCLILISIVFDLNFCLGEYGKGILHSFCLIFFLTKCNTLLYCQLKPEDHFKYPIYVYVFKPRKHELKADFIMLYLVVITIMSYILSSEYRNVFLSLLLNMHKSIKYYIKARTTTTCNCNQNENETIFNLKNSP